MYLLRPKAIGSVAMEGAIVVEMRETVLIPVCCEAKRLYTLSRNPLYVVPGCKLAGVLCSARGRPVPIGGSVYIRWSLHARFASDRKISFPPKRYKKERRDLYYRGSIERS
jgi:hypothetical protein